jgi:predicted DNA-binding transcriptional regulator AlpA
MISRPRPDSVPGLPIEGERLLTKPEVLAKTGLSFPTIWRMMRRQAFPRSRQVASRPMWLNSEVDAWIRALPLVKLKQGDD